jgi:hypothetical protein
MLGLHSTKPFENYSEESLIQKQTHLVLLKKVHASLSNGPNEVVVGAVVEVAGETAQVKINITTDS